MANVPTVSEPTQRQSGSGLNISAPAGAFGASTAGASLGELSKTAEGVSDTFARHAEAMQAIDNKAAVDGATVTLAQRLGQISEDFANNNKGIAAHDNLPAAFTSIEDVRGEIGSTLKSPAAQAAYAQASRIATLQTTQRLASFASTERKDYNVKQISSVVDLAVNASNPGNFDKQMDIVAQQMAVLATPQLQGWSPEEYQAQLAKVRGAAAYNVTAGIAPTSPVQAQAFYNAHKTDMTPQQRTATENLIRSSAGNITVSTVADEYTAHASNPPASPDAVWKNIIHQESGGRAGVVGPPTPYGRAEGLTQMLPATARAMAQKLGVPYEPARMRGTGPEDAAYQEKLGRAYFDEGLAKYGGDVAKAAAYYHGGPDERIHGPKTAAYVAAVAGSPQGQSVDALETNAAATYAAIAQDPRLHGDPILVDRAQSRFLQNVSQARTLNNLSIASAKERLVGASEAGNLTDPAELQRAYPEALKDWAALGPMGQRTLTNQLTAKGNAWDLLKTARYNELVGMRENNTAAFLSLDLTHEDIPLSGQRQLSSDQQKLIAKKTKGSATQASMSRALSNEFVKQGLVTAKLKPDTSEYNTFTGALYAELEEWTGNHPGKKPTDQEIGSIAAGLLAKRDVPGGRYLWEGGPRIGDATVSVSGYAVPEKAAAELTTQFKARYGRDPTASEVAYFYRKAGGQ